jgi:hypothetical protein
MNVCAKYIQKRESLVLSKSVNTLSREIPETLEMSLQNSSYEAGGCEGLSVRVIASVYACESANSVNRESG